MTTTDRAEQAKALIEEAEEFNPSQNREHDTYYSALLVERLAAALTASEAEVTRLQAGIAEALAITKTMRGDEGPNNFIRKANDAFAILERLSQPTTDTNGAHA